MASPGSKVNLTLSGTYGVLPYVEHALPQENWQENDCALTRRLVCPWNNRRNFIANLMGTVATNRNRASGMTRIVPQFHPDSAFYDKYSVPYGMIEGTYQIRAPFTSKYYAVGAKLVSAGSVPLQQQELIEGVNGWLVYGNKPVQRMVSDVDYDSETGDLLGSYAGGSGAWNGTGSAYGEGDAVYDVTYRPLPFAVKADNAPLTDNGMDQLPAPLNTCELGRYVQRIPQFGARVLAFPAGTTHWKDYLQAGNTTGIPEGAGLKTLPYATITYRWYHVPIIPWGNILSCYGKVNAAESGDGAPAGRFDSMPSPDATLWADGTMPGWLPGVLLFEGVSRIEQVTTACSQIVWNIDYTFRYLPGKDGSSMDTHNKIYRQVDADWYEVVTNYTPNKPSAQWKKIYEAESFNKLFRLF